MRYKNGLQKSLKKYFVGLFFVLTLLFIIASSNKKSVVVASNINTVKSIESSRIIETEIENEEPVMEQIYVEAKSVDDIKNNNGNLIEFVGTLTGYGPDCPGCSGVVACPPNLNVLNNNIYYNDSTYGVVRILAADPSIPCGSIIKINNLYDEELFGIVLDRGKDIHGLTMDLLFDSEKSTISFERKYNINFKVARWGF